MMFVASLQKKASNHHHSDIQPFFTRFWPSYIKYPAKKCFGLPRILTFPTNDINSEIMETMSKKSFKLKMIFTMSFAFRLFTVEWKNCQYLRSHAREAIGERKRQENVYFSNNIFQAKAQILTL
jgi:hypothetical protein